MLSIFSINDATIKSFLEGFLEITKGCFSIKHLALPLKESIILCNAIISFGGVCVMMQAMSFLKTCFIKTNFYLLQKATHMVFSTLICMLLLFVFM
jgi:hypothetical protein